MPGRLDRPRSSGMTLVEAAIAMVIVAVLLTAAMESVGSAARTAQGQSRLLRSRALARQLLAEILTRKYAEPGGGTTLGPDAGENTANRLAFDDVDDYNGWSACPPQQRDGTPMDGWTGWTRSVAVVYVDPTTLQPTGSATTDSHLKRITVTVRDPQGRATSLTAYRGDHSLYDQTPANATTYLSAVDVELQIGPDGNARIDSGVNLLNRVAAGGS